MSEMNWDQEVIPDNTSIAEMDQIGADLAALMKVKDEAMAVVDEATKKVEAQKKKLLAYLKHFNREKFEVPGLGTFYIRSQFSVKTPKSPEAREAFFNYLKQKGAFDDMITVNHQTLNAYYNAELDAAQQAGVENFKIPGLDDPSLYETITMRKAK